MQVRPRLVQVVRRSEEVRTPGDPLTGIDRLIVVRNDRLGDLVLTLPAIAALRRAYSGARLSLAVRPDLAPLARMFTCVDEVVEAAPEAARLRSVFESARPDLVVCVSRDAAGARAAAAARVRNRVGTGYRLYSGLFTRTVGERRRRGGRHEAEYALSFAHRSGAPAGEACFPIRIPDELDGRVADWLRPGRVEGPLVVLHPGSGGSCPGWPAGHYAALAEGLQAEGLSVVISIGPEDAAVADLLGRGRGGRTPDSRFTGELAELAALLRRADLVVSNSTGPLHLAAALGTPTLGLFAPWSTCNAARWGPYAANGWVIEADLPEALKWSRARRARSGRNLLGEIPPHLVLEYARQLSRGRPPAT